jgi:hypothetical protein
VQVFQFLAGLPQQVRVPLVQRLQASAGYSALQLQPAQPQQLLAQLPPQRCLWCSARLHLHRLPRLRLQRHLQVHLQCRCLHKQQTQAAFPRIRSLDA